jgi:prepilin-type N-terminal cleavage/methylation domain-containing protein
MRIHHQTGGTTRGFTIVELLIVIVVIGIMATITILSYVGIQDRAKAAGIQADIKNTATQLKIDYVNTGAYPATLSLANNGNGIKAGSTTYQYTVNNGVSPATFCLTGVNGTSAYMISEDGSPTNGLCSGHTLTGGSNITNLAKNTSCESPIGTTNWSAASGGSYGTATIGLAGSGYSGSNACRQTWSTASSGVTGGPNISTAGSSAVTAGLTYTISSYARPSKTQSMGVVARWLNASNGTVGSDLTSSGTQITGGAWGRVSYTLTAPATATQLRYFIAAVPGTGGVLWAASDTLDVDAVMVTEGSTLYTFADGSSAGWTWSGTVNNSTSTGPQL